MKRFLAISCLCACSIVTATPSDDLRQAIINSNLKQVLKLLPSIPEEEKDSFVQLAQEVIDKSKKEYKAYRNIPPISFSTLMTFAVGLTTYLGCTQKDSSYGLSSNFVGLEIMAIESVQKFLNDPEIQQQVTQKSGIPLQINIDLSNYLENLHKTETNIFISHLINKVGIAAGIGLMVASVWRAFRDKKKLHDAYSNALEIKYALIQYSICSDICESENDTPRYNKESATIWCP